MAITAASSANRIVRKGPGKSIGSSGKALTNSSSTWGQGEIICRDSTSHCLRRVAATGDALTLVGISDNVVTGGKLAGPYDGLTAVDAASRGPDFEPPKYGVVGRMNGNTGDALTPLCKLYLVDGADSATLGVTDPGDANYVGLYQGAALTVVAGQQIDALIGCRWPRSTGADLIF